MSVQQNNHIKCTQIRTYCMVKDSKNSAQNIILLWTTTNHADNDNVPRQNPQKHSDTKIEYSHPYISELVEICQNIGFLENLQANFYWRIGFLLCKYLRNLDKNYITMIAIKTYIIPFTLITLVTYTGLSLIFPKIICIFHLWLWIKTLNLIYTTSVIKFHILKAESLEIHKKY